MINKIAIIIPDNPERQPHVALFTRLFDEYRIDYEIICWVKNGVSLEHNNWHVYNNDFDNRSSIIQKFIYMYKFCIFTKKIIRRNKYKYLISFSISSSIFLFDLLIRKYRNKYIFDIRDYSQILNIFPCKRLLNILINNSFFTTISSLGFLAWLPKNANKYILSHNIDECKLKVIFPYDINLSTKRILTIGNLRDVDANTHIINAFCNTEYKLEFAGDGYAAPILKEYCIKEEIRNVIFKGAYKKADEDSIIDGCDIMNIYLPNNTVSNYLMTNRFYLSVLFCKPMIVSSGCFQAELVKRFNLGVVVSKNDDIYHKVNSYIHSFDKKEYYIGRNDFLNQVRKDVEIFHNHLLSLKLC